ncbi:MAG: membrane dipeptidase [Firmicutes bacterium]|nr:membrane dipeptidase [Bacillota bacterium]
MYIADMHCDTIMQLWLAKLRGTPINFRDSGNGPDSLQVDLAKLKQGGGMLQHFALYTDLKLPADFNGSVEESALARTSTVDNVEYMSPWYQYEEMLKVYREEMKKNSDLIRETTTYEDLMRNQRDGVISSILSIEEGGVIEGDISRIQTLYDEGIRMMTLTWNFENELGYPNEADPRSDEDFSYYFKFQPATGNGLKAKGIEAVEEMDRLGILPDVSHLSDEGFYDLAKLMKGPFVASHSNARALAGCNRNMTDDMIKTMGNHGGVIGVNFCPAFLEEADDESKCWSTVEVMAKHARHMMNVGGKEVVGLGTDFDGIGKENLQVGDASKMQMLVDGFERAGFTPDEIEGICYKNVMKVYKEIL